MRVLLRLVTMRYLLASPARTGLTLFGILLGVAVIFAIDVVNTSVLASFRTTVDDIAGKTALQVGGEGPGVAEELLETVRATEGVAAAVPVIVETARDVKTDTQLAVLGVDTLSDSKVRDYEVTADDVQIEDELAFLNDPHAVLVTREFAARATVAVGDELTLETVKGKETFTIRGLLAARGPAKVFGGDLLVMDVYAAQIAFGRDARFDRIDVVPVEGADVDELAARIDAAIGSRAPVSRPQRRSQEAERILAGFRMGLSLASLVAIFVGGFIVYNALAIAVAQRRREIGILRALGATRGKILALFVGEGIVMGAVGSALGLLAGVFLARIVLGFVGSTVSDLYMRVRPEGLSIGPWQLVLGFSAGVAASFVAAFFPARRAAYIEPASAMRKKVDASDLTLSSVRASLMGAAVMMAGAVAVGLIAHVRESYLLGYVVAIFLSFTGAFLAPSLSRVIGSIARRLFGRIGPTTRLAADAFDRNAGRNSVTIAALSMALANVIIVAAFSGSMRDSLVNWFERSIRAQIVVFAGREVKAKFEHPLPEELGAGIRAIDGVEVVNEFRMVKQTFREEPYYLISHDLRKYIHYNEIPVVDGSVEESLPEVEAGTGIWASESFARTYKVKKGDSITLGTPDGPRSFRVAMVYIDYSADIGILCTTREVYTRVWKDRLTDSYGLYLKEGTDPATVRRKIADEFGGKYGLMVMQNVDYQRELLAMIDRSFTLTYALEVVAIIVAVLGIVNTLLVSVIDRRMEIGILKAIGAVGPQVRRMFVVEAGLIGFSAAVLGLLIGGVYSVYIVKELMRFQMGWALTYRFPWEQAVQVFVVAQIVAWAGAWWPARRAARLDVVDALEYE